MELRNRKVNKNQANSKETNEIANNLKSNEDLVIETTPESNSYHLTRIILVRFLAFIYAVAFLISLNQNHYLIGSNGLTPANKYMQKIHQQLIRRPKFASFGTKLNLFLNVPTLFWFFDWANQIDNLLLNTSLAGLTLSIIILIMGSANSVMMLLLWLFYHSIVNIGQTWYSFGWESQLLESGFIAIFMVPFFSLKQIDPKSPPSRIHIMLYRWLIFRIMLGAGLIKIRGDSCWLDFTCMNYFYEVKHILYNFIDIIELIINFFRLNRYLILYLIIYINLQ